MQYLARRNRVMDLPFPEIREVALHSIFQLLATLWLWKYLIDLLELSGRIVRIILPILQPRHNVIDVVHALIGSKYGCFGHLPE